METNPEGDYHQALAHLLLSSLTTNPITTPVVIALVVLVLLLFASAFVSGSEVAFFSLSKSHLQELRENKGERVLHLLERPRLLLATILIANNLFNISIVMISYFVLTQVFTYGDAIVQFLIEVILVTFVIVLFGEVIPKVYANYNNLAFSRRAAQPILIMRRIFRPLGMVLVNSTRVLEKRLAKHQNRLASKEEIGAAIDIAGQDLSSQEEKNILKGIVKFGDITVRQIMHPRMDIVAVDKEANFKTVFNLILESGYSRLPVYEETLDNVEGILYAKDLLKHINADGDFDWHKLVRPAFFVPENKRIEDLLREFQTKHIHLAIAVDEYGGTAGVVTLEDIMEEIIGEIKDEFDEHEELDYEQVDPRTFTFEGKILINDFCKVLGLPNAFFDNVQGEADSLAGLLLEIFEKIPGANERITYNNYEFEVLSVTKKRIQKVKVTIPQDEE